MQKNEKKLQKICIYQKFVAILHPLSKMKDTKYQKVTQKQTEK